jgi:hypothetical protein
VTAAETPLVKCRIVHGRLYDIAAAVEVAALVKVAPALLQDRSISFALRSSGTRWSKAIARRPAGGGARSGDARRHVASGTAVSVQAITEAINDALKAPHPLTGRHVSNVARLVGLPIQRHAGHSFIAYPGDALWRELAARYNLDVDLEQRYDVAAEAQQAAPPALETRKS